MNTRHQVRWISRKRVDALRRSGTLRPGLLLESFNGYLIVEPAGSNLGDGAVLSPQEADYELQEVWVAGSKVKLAEARRLLGLEVEHPMAELIGVGD